MKPIPVDLYLKNLSSQADPQRSFWSKRTVLGGLLAFSLFSLSNPHEVQAQSRTTTGEPDSRVFFNQAQYRYSNPTSRQRYLGRTNTLSTSTGGSLIDPLGRIRGCGGELLTDYTGFGVSIYETNPTDPTGSELGRLLDLTPTEAIDIPNNGVSAGLEPNVLNVNPFFLSNADEGRYNFLFDPERGQTDPGDSYILVIQPPPNSIYQERRIRLEIVDSTGNISNNIIRYLATSLDGQPISAEGGMQIEDNVVFVPDAEQVGLDLLALQLDSILCNPDQVSITKTADRASAQPGDVVLYRLAVRNQSDAPLEGLTFTDVLPRGLRLIERSVTAEIAREEIAIATSVNGSVVTMTTDVNLPAGEVMNVIYAAQVTPDAVRGSGRNSAVVDASRSDNGFAIKDGPAIHELRIRDGILSNYGILLGRVFEDKNGDGQQQRGEAGLPNAVIFLQDGNRVVTDENGLFSVSDVQPGYHSGVLDLSSVPGYQFASSPYRRELNSESRLVRLAPGSMARMNFPVAPILPSSEVPPSESAEPPAEPAESPPGGSSGTLPDGPSDTPAGEQEVE